MPLATAAPLAHPSQGGNSPGRCLLLAGSLLGSGWSGPHPLEELRRGCTSLSTCSVQFSPSVESDCDPVDCSSQAPLSITNSQSSPKLMSIEPVMPSNHLLLCHPLLLPPSIFPNIRVFSNESVLCIRWPKYWSFSFNISPSNEHPGLIFFRMD